MNREMRRLQQREERRTKQLKRSPQQRTRRTGPGGEQLGFFARIRQFLREVRAELKRAHWPTREQMVAFTTVVLITTTALTLVVFGMDWAFKNGILKLLELGA